MRKIVVFATLLAWVTFTGGAQNSQNQGAKSETLLQWHFAGTKQLAAHKDLKTFRTVAGLPETEAFQKTVAQSLAAQAAKRFNKGGNTNANAELARLIEPLLPELWRNESVFKMSARGGEDSDWGLAVKLDDARSQEWSKNLAQLAKAAGMDGASPDSKTWTAQQENYRLAFSREKDWTIIEGGFGKADEKMAKDFRAALNRRQSKEVLRAEVNSPLLAKIWSAHGLQHAPKLTLRSEPRGDGLWSEMMMEYPEPLGIKLERWNVPTGLIHEPLIGFTAIQGVEKKLASMKSFQALGAKETPNQVFAWTHELPPFSFWIAGEVKNPVEVVDNAARALKDTKLPIGYIQKSTNRPALFWMDTPVVRPFLEAAAAPHSTFAAAGLFPSTPLQTNTIPAALLDQLKKRNLVYYDWEITGQRLRRIVPVWQYYHFVFSKALPLNNSSSSTWLAALVTKLGNTVTEATLENPRRIKLVRSGQLGFNSVELTLLAHLLDTGDLMNITEMQQRNLQRMNRPVPAVPKP